MLSEPMIEQRPAHPYAAVRLKLPMPFGSHLQPAWSKTEAWLARQGIAHGPAIIRYLTTDMTTQLDMEVGFVTGQLLPPGEGIVTGVLPAGRYACLLYTGSYRGKGIYKANVALIQWAEANGIAWKRSMVEGVEEWDGRVEWYFNDPALDPDPQNYRTELTILVAEP